MDAGAFAGAIPCRNKIGCSKRPLDIEGIANLRCAAHTVLVKTESPVSTAVTEPTAADHLGVTGLGLVSAGNKQGMSHNLFMQDRIRTKIFTLI